MSLWSWLVDQKAISGDPGYYSGGKASASEYRHAIEVAESFFAGKGTTLWAELVKAGAIAGDPKYYSDRKAQPGELDNAINVADKFFGGSGLPAPAFGESGATRKKPPDSVRAIPRDARLVKVAGNYRVLWDLGDGLGSAWYAINGEQLKNIYGENYDQYVTQTFANTGVFEARYGNYYWGNVAEISITADTPWQDLKDRIFSTFGFISGLDDPEVRRTVLQGYFEGWSNNEFIAHYQQTKYYNSLNDSARQWAIKSDAEKASLIKEKTVELLDRYRAQWGSDPVGGLTNSELITAAQNILSGKLTQDEWNYNTRIAAAKVDTTPAARTQAQEERAQGEQQATITNLAGVARDYWRKWMGPVEMPSDFAQRWGEDLYWNRKSEEDLDMAMRSLSQGTWSAKPEDVTWEEWAAPVKTNIRNLLELPSVGDQDPLLSELMSGGYAGQDATKLIRNDPRFRQTNRLYSELADAAQSLGRTFGFIA
jgi:hypothetical protein